MYDFIRLPAFPCLLQRTFFQKRATESGSQTGIPESEIYPWRPVADSVAADSVVLPQEMNQGCQESWIGIQVQKVMSSHGLQLQSPADNNPYCSCKPKGRHGLQLQSPAENPCGTTAVR